MEEVARVVLALEEPDVAEEVMHFLDRSGRARVVATAQDDRQLQAAVRQLEPDAVVAQPSLVPSEWAPKGPFLALDTRESVASLRAAIRAGASGFFVWPSDRDELAGAAAATVAVAARPVRRAVVVGVHAARGGAGATFVASHLAAAFARLGRDVVVLDADPLYGDVAAALGAPVDEVHTVADLLPLGAELDPDHLAEALWTHGDGFRVLLPPTPDQAAAVRAEDLRTFVGVAASSCDAVVLHLPRALDELARVGIGACDRVLEVLSLDVLSFRAASRALEALDPFTGSERLGFVVNRAARSEIAPADVTRVFGVEPLAIIPFDRSVTRAQDHGRLLSRGRMARAFDRLAVRVLEPASAEATAAVTGP